MITSISLTSFKAFSELSKLVISPLTILCGINSSGKSSVLHSLLLLKQSLSEDLPEQALTLDGQYLQYTHLKEVSFGVPQEASASIEYEFELKEDDGFSGTLCFEIRHKTLPQDESRKGPVINSFSWSLDEGQKKTKIRLRKGIYPCPRILSVNLPPFPKDFVSTGEPIVQFRHFLPEQLMVPARKKKEKPENDEKYLIAPLAYFRSPLNRLTGSLKRDLERIRYLGPSRAVPRRAYVHYSERRYDLDEDGGNSAYVFWLRRNELVRWRNEKVPLEQAVQDCLTLMGLRQHVTPKRAGYIVYQLFVDTLSAPQKKVTLPDVGFGYSQVLPIILRGLLAEENALLLFEQPEIHLHPSSKAKLAELFLAFVESGKRMMVETHSTELINALQLNVIKNPDLRKKINVTFIEPPITEGIDGAKITQLSFKEDGMFDAWPDGFCDESEKLARAILEARIRGSADNG